MKIAFASCMDARRRPSQPVWKAIRQQQPDLLLLLGDQIYMDWGLWESLKSKPSWKGKGLDAFARNMHMRYALQWQHQDFQQLVRSMQGRVCATRDDHDFAWNDSTGAGDEKHYPRCVPQDMQAASHRLFRQFLDKLQQPGDPEPSYPSFDEAQKLPGTSNGVVEMEQDGVVMMVLDERLGERPSSSRRHASSARTRPRRCSAQWGKKAADC